jgi:hypothetical protein
MDADVLEQIRERLRVSTRVGDERIVVASRDDDVVLLGAVASPEEATVAGQPAEALDENLPWSPPDVAREGPGAPDDRAVRAEIEEG